MLVRQVTRVRRPPRLLRRYTHFFLLHQGLGFPVPKLPTGLSTKSVDKPVLPPRRQTGAVRVIVLGHAPPPRLIGWISSRAADVDEFALAGLTPVPGRNVNVPPVGQSPAALECRLLHVVRLSTFDATPMDNWRALGQVVGVHIREEFLKGSLRADRRDVPDGPAHGVSVAAFVRRNA
jgi:hypothetical protein